MAGSEIFKTTLKPEQADFIAEDLKERFCRYVRVHTTSQFLAVNKPGPSSECQWELLRMLESECRELGLEQVELTNEGYLYATIPSTASTNVSSAAKGERFALYSHVDTSPEQPGENVNPRLIENYDGTPISYPDDPELFLTIDDEPKLKDLIGDTLIVASGKTLLGLDDKGGVAAMMCLATLFKRYPELEHGEIQLVFTRDEEIGLGVTGIDYTRLPLLGYTVDGDFAGEYETECFEGWAAAAHFKGKGVHPGVAKGKLVNAATAAARFVALLPRDESPENTAGRDGFYYVSSISGTVEDADVRMIIRDFESEKNQERIRYLEKLRRQVLEEFPNLQLELKITPSYRNMREVIRRHPEVTDKLRLAISDAGLTPKEKPIRGGTDGCKLAEHGRPVPNIFSGGGLGHSRKEFASLATLVKVVETLVHLARRYRGECK